MIEETLVHVKVGQFDNELKAEKFMMDYYLENGFYISHSPTNYEVWVTAFESEKDNPPKTGPFAHEVEGVKHASTVSYTSVRKRGSVY